MAGRLISAVVFAALALQAACTPADSPAPQPPAAAYAEAPLPAAPVNTLTMPPTVNGIFIAKDACPGEGCYLKGRIKAYEATSLLVDSLISAAVLATIAPGEWVDIVRTEDRLIPTPGKIRATGEGVYMLGYEGEGCSTVWNKGQLSSWCDDGGDPANAEIAWSTPLESTDPSLGFWVEVKRENGQSGWLTGQGIRNFGCTGYQDRDADCPPLPQ